MIEYMIQHLFALDKILSKNTMIYLYSNRIIQVM